MKEFIKDAIATTLAILILLIIAVMYFDTNKKIESMQASLSKCNEYNYSIENKIDTLQKTIEILKKKRK